METSSLKSKLKSPVLRLKLPVDTTLVSNSSMQNRLSLSPVPNSLAPQMINLAQKHNREEIYNSGLPLPGWLKTRRRTTLTKVLPVKSSSFSRERADKISPSTESHLPFKKRRSNAEHEEAESSMHSLVVTENIDAHKIHTISSKQYMCNICHKTFKSYQALGGHKVHHNVKVNREEQQREGICGLLHECTFCDKIFSTGQALGGHKRHCREPAPEKVHSPVEKREKKNQKIVFSFDLNELPTE